MRGRRASKIYLLPHLAAGGRARAQALGLAWSTYCAVLLRNEVGFGVPGVLRWTTGELGHSRIVREELPLSLPAGLYEQARQRADGLGASVSRLVEELVHRDLARGGDLVVKATD